MARRHCLIGCLSLRMNAGPRGGVVTQRSAKPFTPVQFRAWPPISTAGRCPSDRLPKRLRPLSKRGRLCYMRTFIAPSRLFPGSSAVEQPAVNRLVAGSNPARGAKHLAKVRKEAITRSHGDRYSGKSSGHDTGAPSRPRCALTVLTLSGALRLSDPHPVIRREHHQGFSACSVAAGSLMIRVGAV